MFQFFGKTLIIILPFFYLFNCGSFQSNGDRKTGPALYLAVSPKIKELFPVIEKSHYQYQEVDRLFDTMTVKGNAFCKMLYGLQRFDYNEAKKFIDQSQLELFRRKSEKGTIQTLMAGCWNFFVLNDTYPNRDFKLVRALYPQAQFDCYSVGMLQPYMMHNALSCQTLTMLDIDWRILDGHRQLLKLFNRKSFGDGQGIAAALEKLVLGWVAFANPFQAEQSANLDLLCQRYQHDLCKKEMWEFQKTYAGIKAFHLNLAGLHDGSYIKSKNDTTIVVFLSNAIESYYCTKEQFVTMLKKIRTQLKDQEKAILIYHVGGRPQLGVYELVKTSHSHALFTMCKDEYLSDTTGGKEVKEYRTYLDETTNTRGRIPSCQELLQKFSL